MLGACGLPMEVLRHRPYSGMKALLHFHGIKGQSLEAIHSSNGQQIIKVAISAEVQNLTKKFEHYFFLC